MSAKGRSFAAELTAAAALFLALAGTLPASPPPAEEAPAAAATETAGSRQAMVWSLVYPGIGQLLERRTGTGVALLVAETAAVALAISADHRANGYYWRYRQATSREEAVSLRRQTERLDRRRNVAIACGVAIWGLNLLEMMLHHRKKPRSAAQGVQLDATVQPFVCGLRLTF